jgi:hypothetical protein
MFLFAATIMHETVQQCTMMQSAATAATKHSSILLQVCYVAANIDLYILPRSKFQ